MNQTRNPYLIRRAMEHFLFASVLTMTISQLTSTLNSIIVSHLVCPDALAAITLYVPVGLVVTAMSTFVGVGATVLAARAMGSRDKEAVNGILSTALTSVLIVGACFAVAGFLFGDTITSWLTSDEHLAPQLKPYLTVMFGGSVMMMLNQFFSQCICVDGHPLMVTRANVLVLVTNVVLDLLLVGAVGMGIQGSAIATVLAYLLSTLYLSRQFFGRESYIKFGKPAFSKWLGPNLLQGMPMLISNIVLTLMFFFINTIVQGRLGHDGMFVMSVCMNILMIGIMLSNGFGQTILSLGGFLYGQVDYTGTRILVRRCLWFILGITLVLTAFVMLFPGILTRLFGANTPELQAMANTGVIIFIGCLAPICVILTLANLFQMEGRIALSPVVIVQVPIVLLTLLSLFSRSSDDTFIWYAFPASGVVVLALVFLITEFLRFRSRPTRLVPLLLLPKDQTNKVYEVSLKNDVPTFYATIKEMPQLLTSFDLTREQCQLIENCTEELLLNTIQHSGIADNGHYTDLRILQTDDKVTVSLKYEGKAFNPTILSEEKKQMGLKIVSGFSDEMDYKYMYGQNMLYLSWTTVKDER